jgi:hypothetical protein
MDLTVTKGTLVDDEIKERWAYWKAPVQKGFSLTKDPLQKIGILFETTDSTQSVKNYPFLGMQLFKHIPYEKTIEETIRVPLEDDEKNKIIADSIVMDLDLEKIPLDETGIADDNKNPTLQEIQESVSEQIQNELKNGGVNGLIKKIYNNLFSFWAKLTDSTPQTRSANITNANNETLINRVDNIGTIAKTMKNIEYKDFLVSDYLAKYGLKLTVVETPEATEEVQFKVSTI